MHAAEIPDHWHRRLLRPRRERPRRCRNANQRDEVAAADVDCHVTLLWKVMSQQPVNTDSWTVRPLDSADR
jgi:hypothetical protein